MNHPILKGSALLMTIALLLSVAFSSVGMISSADEPIAFTVGTVTASVGDIVEIPFDVSEGHYMVNGTMLISFDPTALRLLPDEVALEEDLTSLMVLNDEIFKNTMYASAMPENGHIRLAFASGRLTGSTVGGCMFTLQFEVLSEGPIPVTLAFWELCSSRANINGGKPYNTVYTVLNGGVNIAAFAATDTTTTTTKAATTTTKAITTTEAPPVPTKPVAPVVNDLDGDSVVNIKDAFLLYHTVSGKRAMTRKMSLFGDMDHNGVLNIIDAYLFYRQVAGMPDKPAI